MHLARARRWLQDARRIALLTGAGVSAESGIPTFRAAGALAQELPEPRPLWTRYRPEDLATPQAFARDPVLVSNWYAWRRERVTACAPNQGHLAIARALGRWGSEGRVATLITQNVDGLHQAAADREGLDIPAPIALHGSLCLQRCTRCERPPWEAGLAPHRPVWETVEQLPTCPACGGLARPHVVWFGESLCADTLSRAHRAASEACVMIVIGTSAVVQPAASLALLTQGGGGKVIEVNPNATPLTDHCDAVLRAAAGDVLPKLLAC